MILQEIQRRYDVCNPLCHVDVIPLTLALSVSAHVNGQGCDAPCREKFTELEVVLLEVHGAVTEYQGTRGIIVYRQEEGACNSISIGGEVNVLFDQIYTSDQIHSSNPASFLFPAGNNV